MRRKYWITKIDDGTLRFWRLEAPDGKVWCGSTFDDVRQAFIFETTGQMGEVGGKPWRVSSWAWDVVT